MARTRSPSPARSSSTSSTPTARAAAPARAALRRGCATPTGCTTRKARRCRRCCSSWCSAPAAGAGAGAVASAGARHRQRAQSALHRPAARDPHRLLGERARQSTWFAGEEFTGGGHPDEFSARGRRGARRDRARPEGHAASSSASTRALPTGGRSRRAGEFRRWHEKYGALGTPGPDRRNCRPAAVPKPCSTRPAAHQKGTSHDIASADAAAGHRSSRWALAAAALLAGLAPAQQPPAPAAAATSAPAARPPPPAAKKARAKGGATAGEASKSAQSYSLGL